MTRPSIRVEREPPLRREAERSREARERNARSGAARLVAGEGRHGA